MADQKLKKAAEELRSKGRGGDTILAHINPHEAAMLKMMGGAGTKNPDTGLPEFLDISDDSGTVVATGGTLPPEILPASDVARIQARPWGQSAVGGGFFGGLTAEGIKQATNVWMAVAIPYIGAEIGAALMESGVLTSAAQASAAATASGATAAQAAAAGTAATQTATTVGTAIANATRMVANGTDVQSALVMAASSAAIGSQTPNVAKQINDVVQNPVVTNLIASTGASIAQTAAAGGNEQDILNNARAALVGSGVSSATGSNIVGRAAGGAVTGGVAGALVGAAGALGSSAAKPDTTTTATAAQPEKTTETVSVTKAEEPTKTAEPTTTTTTETTATAPVTTDQAVIDLTGIGAGNAAVTTEQGTTPGATDTFTGGVDLGETGTTDQAGTFTGGVDLGETGAVTQPDTFTGGVDLGDTGPETQTDTFTGAVDLGDTGDVIDTGGVDLGETGGDAADTEKEVTTEDKTYKPELFVYGGKTPKAPTTAGRQTTNLGTTLQAPFYPTSTLGQALTGYRGAGEIEGKKSGKPRKNVWNEESLRLKDALGL